MTAEFTPLFSIARSGDATQVFSFIGKELLATADGALAQPAVTAALGAPAYSHLIGRTGNTVYQLQAWQAETALPPELRQADFRKVLTGWPHDSLDALSRARQLATWLSETRHCGACGSVMETDAISPARKCPACSFIVYPRLSPVGMVLVSRGDEILLARSPHFSPGLYSALAGHVEAGESLEACIHREVREEVGIAIQNLRWFGSQSWPLTNAMMLGFTADYAGGNLVLQPEEIEDAGWFRRDNLPDLPHRSTLAYRMIDAWCRRAVA